MSDEEETIDAKALGITESTVGNSTAPTFYANNVSVTVSPWDLRLRFQLIDEVDTEKKEIRYKDVVTVYLSPRQAQAFGALLNKHLPKYQTFWNVPVGQPLEEAPEKNAKQD